MCPGCFHLIIIFLLLYIISAGVEEMHEEPDEFVKESVFDCYLFFIHCLIAVFVGNNNFYGVAFFAVFDCKRAVCSRFFAVNIPLHFAARRNIRREGNCCSVIVGFLIIRSIALEQLEIMNGINKINI